MLLSMKLTDISPAIALTPLDGRYHKQTAPLVEYMSEPALNRERCVPFRKISGRKASHVMPSSRPRPTMM